MTTRRRFIAILPLAGISIAGCSPAPAPAPAAAPPPAAPPAPAPAPAPAAAAPAPAAAGAAAAGKVAPSEPQASALGYVEDASKTDRSKWPRYEPGQACANCTLYTGKAGEAAGPCAIFGGRLVAAQGWCNSWTKKPT